MCSCFKDVIEVSMFPEDPDVPVDPFSAGSCLPTAVIQEVVVVSDTGNYLISYQHTLLAQIKS